MRAARGLPPLPYDALAADGGLGRARHARRRASASARRRRATRRCATSSSTATSSACCSETRVFDAIAAGARRARAARPALGHRHQQGAALRRAAGARARRCCRALPRWSAATARRTPSRTRRRCSRRRGAWACRRRHCVYVGDDLRDMQAGRAAGMGALAAAWGYLGVGRRRSTSWGADLVLAEPGELLNCWNWPKLRCSWDRPGFDVGTESARGMPSTSSLVNPLETK